MYDNGTTQQLILLFKPTFESTATITTVKTALTDTNIERFITGTLCNLYNFIYTEADLPLSFIHTFLAWNSFGSDSEPSTSGTSYEMTYVVDDLNDFPFYNILCFYICEVSKNEFKFYEYAWVVRHANCSGTFEIKFHVSEFSLV